MQRSKRSNDGDSCPFSIRLIAEAAMPVRIASWACVTPALRRASQRVWPSTGLTVCVITDTLQELTSQICYTFGMTPGQLIRATRARHGLSQARLARRVGSHQSAISRLEADEVSPSVETMKMLMHAMGERLDLSGAPLERGYDPAHRRGTAERPPAERLALGISWNRMAGRLAAAGREARGRA